ncbi:type II toxin-antitoxin system PemK/MazF family toxin [Nitrosopumilus sp.]|uniref:type II toxin-antitoxin system PemK/MazF family toxin n=1 Tax=Nitrosopumilus sp. TaxID=2024843 RepID=UPI003B5C2206
MINTDSLKPRDIVLANPEYPDQKEQKIRPLLVISQQLFHQNSQYVVCLGVTTNTQVRPYLIHMPRKEIEDGELISDSQIMCERIVSLRQDKLSKRIATVTPEFYRNVIEKLKKDVLQI